MVNRQVSCLVGSRSTSDVCVRFATSLAAECQRSPYSATHRWVRRARLTRWTSCGRGHHTSRSIEPDAIVETGTVRGGRSVFFGRESLENAVSEYVKHYHAERIHQGLGNELNEPNKDAVTCDGHIECRERLGGMLKFYHRHAA